MLNRRILRVKAFKVLYGNVYSGAGSIVAAEKELLLSCEKCRDLYLFMLNLARALKAAEGESIAKRKNKFFPTEEDLNPNMKFFENAVPGILAANADFVKQCEKKKLLWNEHDAFVRHLLKAVYSREYFQKYMENGERSLADDCALFVKIYENELEDNEELEQIIDDMSIYWMDDLGYVLNYIVKTLKTVKKDGVFTIPALFQSDMEEKGADVEDDRKYVIKLLDYAMANYDRLFRQITESTKNWDSDRLVSTDAALIVLGLSEAIAFPSIPVKVTINEYVEISKYYSTANSRVFVNGLLDRQIQKGLEDGTIVKSGKGLL